MYDTLTDPDQIVDAVKALAGQCDGAQTQDGIGFNGRDTNFGRNLAQLPGQLWSPAQVYSAYRMLATYKNTQLPALGIDWEGIKAPPKPQDTTWEARRDAQQAAKLIKQQVAVLNRRAQLVGANIKLSWEYRDPDFNSILPSFWVARGRPSCSKVDLPG